MSDLDRLLEPDFYGNKVKIDVWLSLTEWKELESQLEKWANIEKKGWIQITQKLYDEKESQIKTLQEINKRAVDVSFERMNKLEQCKAIIDEIKEYVETSNLKYFSEVGGLKTILAKSESK